MNVPAQPADSGWPTRSARAWSGRRTPRNARRSSTRRGRDGSPDDSVIRLRAQPMRRCSSAVCGPCCCNRCTRWRWPASRSTATTGTTRGDGCSAPPSSWPTTTYGPAAAAERAVARVRAVHDRVTGVAPDGRPYSANDPHLLRWVHVCEVDSFLVAYRRYGATPARLPNRPMSTSPRQPSSPARSVSTIPRARWPSCAPSSPTSVPNCRAPGRRARPRGSCCSSLRCRWPPERRTRCWPLLRCRCCRCGPGGRCGCRCCPSARPCWSDLRAKRSPS